MRKRILIIVSIVLLIISLAAVGCSPGEKNEKKTSKPETATSKKVKMAYYGGTCEAPAYIAYEQGIFKKKGLDVELVKVNFETLKEGVATGKIDAVQVSSGELKPIEQGLDIKITGGVHTGCIQTVVPKNSAIKTVKDLKGKIIGVEAIGGVPMTLLSIELGKNGINPKTDVTWKAFPAPQLSQALEKGEVDAFSTWDPFGQLAINDKKVNRIFSNTHSAHYKEQYCCFIGINGNLVKEQPETAKAITEALQEATLWVEQNPQEAARISIDKKYTGGDPQTSGQLLDEYTFEVNPAKAKESLRFFLTNLKEQQILDQSTDPEKLLENTFVDLHLQ